MTRSLRTSWLLLNWDCIFFHRRLLMTHSPEIWRLPSSCASASARKPRSPRWRTRKLIGVTMPSLGGGSSEPRSRTCLKCDSVVSGRRAGGRSETGRTADG